MRCSNSRQQRWNSHPRAVLENMTKLQPNGGLDHEDISYYFTIKCESCGSISEEDVRLCRKEKFLVPDPIWSGGKTTNLVYECNVCETTGTILMVLGEGHPLPSSFGETGRYTTIMVFDCDGVKPVRFSLDKTPWEAQFMETEQKIRDIYISDEEFSDVHEHDNEIFPISIWDADAKFVKS